MKPSACGKDHRHIFEIEMSYDPKGRHKINNDLSPVGYRRSIFNGSRMPRSYADSYHRSGAITRKRVLP